MIELIEELEVSLLRRCPDSLNWVGCSDPPISRRQARKLAEEYSVSFDGLAFVGDWDNLLDLIVEIVGPVKIGEESFGSSPIGIRYEDGWWYGGHHPNGYVNRIENIYRWQIFGDRLTLRTAVSGLFRAVVYRLSYFFGVRRV